LALAFCATATGARAQSAAQERPNDGDTELQVWTGGGYSINEPPLPGTEGKITVWNGGLRYGWVLTNAHGPSFLRGRFEYAIEAVPFYAISQPHSTAYGAGVNPFALKWLFDMRGPVMPYFDLGGGALFTTRQVPDGISNINFASGTGVGVNVGRGKMHGSLEVRWLHISDAGLTAKNPGINSIQLRAGLGWFRHKE
jgi:hypothetical protein